MGGGCARGGLCGAGAGRGWGGLVGAGVVAGPAGAGAARAVGAWHRPGSMRTMLGVAKV